MRSAIIDRRLMYLEQLFIDLKEIRDDISVTNDPALIMEYEEDANVLMNDLEDHAQDVLFLLDAYMEDCKNENLPIILEYYKIYKELNCARRLKILHLE